MAYTFDTAAQRRLDGFLKLIGDTLDNQRQRASFATYAYGLFGDGERKSAEPIAARACPDPEGADAAHQRLLHFLGDSPWSDHEVRRAAAAHAIAAMTATEPIDAWVIDDTGFLAHVYGDPPVALGGVRALQELVDEPD